MMVDPEKLAAFVYVMQQRATPRYTPRSTEVFETMYLRLIEGRSNADVARLRGISEKTCEAHATNTKIRLNFETTHKMQSVLAFETGVRVAEMRMAAGLAGAA